MHDKSKQFEIKSKPTDIFPLRNLIPLGFGCLRSGQVMLDPVTNMGGVTVDRSSIMTDPDYNEADWKPNFTLRKVILEFLKKISPT